MTNFSELGLSQKVLNAVKSAGYDNPTPIQQESIPHILQKKDILGIAQTGTGKTASFVLPMLTLLEKGRARARMPRSLILEPTRELAAQVDENFKKYGSNHNLNIALLIGGLSFEKQEKILDRGADVLIATPGRLLDHYMRGKLILSGVEILVVDEADRMLDMGFIPDVENICKMLPFTRQTLFFSATMAPEISKLTEQFLHSPIHVEVTQASLPAKTISQKFIKTTTTAWEKRKILRDLLEQEDPEINNAIIFCNRKKDISELLRSLVKRDFNVGALHGDMDQRNRTAVLANFKSGKLKYLIASDVAARGLDIDDISHVFNYDIPTHAEDYIHRIGRTGRAGRLGKAFSLVTKEDEKYINAITDITGVEPIYIENFYPNEDKKISTPKVEERKPSSKNKKTKQAQEQQVTIKEKPSQKKVKQKPSENKRSEDHNQPILGFGDDIPAFMLVDTKIT